MMVKLNTFFVAVLAASLLSTMAPPAFAQGQAFAPTQAIAQQQNHGPSVYRSPQATTSQATFTGQTDAAAEAMDSPSRGDFPALIVPESMESDEAAVGADGLAGPVVTTVSSLLVVLAIFGALVWISRRYGSARTPAGVLPEDVLRNLGGASIDAKTRVSFLRVGQRILVIGQTANGDPQTLTEIREPEEVERLTNRCLGRPEIVGRRGTFATSDTPSRRDLAAG